MRTLALLGFVVLLTSGGPAAADATPGSPEWEALDLEGKWMAYTRAIAKDSGSRSAWHEWLAREKDHAVLEMIAIYVGWQETGMILADLGAPHWIRVAFWSLDDQRSHSFDDAAARLLTAQPEAVLAWAKRYPRGFTKNGQGVLDKIKVKHPTAKPSEELDALPPLREADVFQALSAPPKLLEFGTRSTAKPGEVYVHQVLRAIRARVRHLPLDERVRDQLLGLSRHPHPTVRQRSMLAFASLPKPLRPISTLYYTANDEREPIGVREAAVRVAGSTGHPALRTWLLDIAYEPAHPLWIAALSELYTMGEGFLLTDRDFAATAPRDADHAELLRKKKRKLRTKWRQMQQKDHLASRLPALFLQAAWLKVSGHARAKDYAGWLVPVARAARNVPGNHKVLMKLSRDPKIAPPVAFAPGAARIPTTEALVNEIRALAGQALQSDDADAGR